MEIKLENPIKETGKDLSLSDELRDHVKPGSAQPVGSLRNPNAPQEWERLLKRSHTATFERFLEEVCGRLDHRLDKLWCSITVRPSLNLYPAQMQENY